VRRFLAVPSGKFHKTTASWTSRIPSSMNCGADLKSPALAGGIAHRPQLGFRADFCRAPTRSGSHIIQRKDSAMFGGSGVLCHTAASGGRTGDSLCTTRPTGL
jgi:hypothetical protein